MNAAIHTYQERAAQGKRDQLVLENLELVRHVLRRVAGDLPVHVDRENLEAAGILGLVEAAHRYDSRRGIKFSTFAYRRIRGAILDELRRNSPLPQQVLERIAAVQRVCDTLPPPVSPEEIAANSSLTLEAVEETLAAMRLTSETSLNDVAGALAQSFAAESASPSEAAERSELTAILTELIERLPDRERLIVTLYYLEDLRLNEIGTVLDLSESRISRLLAAAEFRLASQLRARLGHEPTVP